MVARVVDKRAKERQILEAALKVFARSGINNFKIIEVAREAEIGKGTIYEYFSSKEDLVVGCFRLFMEDFDQHLATELNQSGSPQNKLKRLISASLEFCQGEKDRLDTLFGFYAAGIPRREGQPLLAELAPMYNEMISEVAGIIDEGVRLEVFRPVDAQLTASIILAIIDGLMFQVALRVTELEGPGISDRVSDLLLSGILSDSQKG